MAGGGGQTQTSNSFQIENTKKDPWGPAHPALNKALWMAEDAANKSFSQQLTASRDPWLDLGERNMLGTAKQNLVGQAATPGFGQIRSIIGDQGLSGLQNEAVGNLRPYASGDMIKANPYLDEVLSKAMGDAANATNAQFSAAGRYGSGAHSGSLGKELGGIQAQARLQDYYQQQQNQMAANQAMAGIGQAGVGNLYSAAPALQQYFASQNLGNQAMQDIGLNRQNWWQEYLDRQNQAPWANAANLSNIASQIGGLGGTSQGISMGTKTDRVSGGGGGVIGSILGGGMTGLSFLKNMGGLGGLGALFTGSDVRLKEDIQPVGKTFDGQNIYSYRYKSGGPKVMGLMAQEVLQHKPEAVAQDPESGMLMVNYDKAVA